MTSTIAAPRYPLVFVCSPSPSSSSTSLGAWAETQNEHFSAQLQDLRNRRLAESTLRGWILDRTGSLDRALAFYRRGERGEILREYPLDVEFAQIFGTDRGDAGLERALFGVESGDTPEAYDVLLERNIKQAGNLDVRLTIDSELQKAAAEQLRGRHGAVVAINPQTGEILALYSNPSYSLKAAQDADTWIRLDTNKRDLPLVNRATRSYYIPGSTFKTVTMIAAYVAGMQDTRLTCSGSGYYAAQGAPPIFDDQGAAEVHGTIGIDTAYEVSCNQYFAQLAVKLGPQKMEQAAKLIGIGAMQTPEQARVARRQPEIMNASSEAVAKAISPFQATMVTGPKIKTFDLALEGYGQGYAGQMTPFQMALSARPSPTSKAIDEAEDRDTTSGRRFNQVIYAAARGRDAPRHGAGDGRGVGHGARRLRPRPRRRHHHGRQDRHGAEGRAALRPEDGRGPNRQEAGEGQARQRHPRVRGGVDGARAAHRRLVPLHRPTRPAAARHAVIIEGGGYGGARPRPSRGARPQGARVGPLGLAPAPPHGRTETRTAAPGATHGPASAARPPGHGNKKGRG